MENDLVQPEKWSMVINLLYTIEILNKVFDLADSDVVNRR